MKKKPPEAEKPKIRVTEYFNKLLQIEAIDAHCIGCNTHILHTEKENGQITYQKELPCKCL